MIHTATSELVLDVLFHKGVSSSYAYRSLRKLNTIIECVESFPFGGCVRFAVVLPAPGIEYWRMDIESLPSVSCVEKQAA